MMSSNACENYREELVAFGDGELDAARAAEVSEHVAACPACRRRLAALGASLAAAREVWSEAAAAAPAVVISPGRRRVWRRWVNIAAVGAAASLLVLAYLVERPAARRNAISDSSIASAAELEREIREAGLAAQMLLAGDMLAQTPGGESYAADRFLSITQQYPKTEAARQARERLAAMKERVVQ